MAKIKIRHLVFRDGRAPRWEPSPGLKDIGFRAQNLLNPDGSHMSTGDAIEAAEALNAEADAARTGRPAPSVGLARNPRSVEALWERYIASSKFTTLAAKTQQDYRNKARFFLTGFPATMEHPRESLPPIMPGKTIGDFGGYDCRALTGPAMHGFSEMLLKEKGRHMTLGIMAVFRRLLKYAEIIGWRTKGSNPAVALELPRPEPRLRLGLPVELEALLAASDRLGKPGVGDAIMLALHTGQREMDTLLIPDRLLDSGRIRLSQSKRGAPVDIRLTPWSLDRLRGARERKREAFGRGHNIEPFIADMPIVLCDRTMEGYRDTSQFNKDYREVRTEAAREVESVADFKFLDLRDTAVTRLAMSGCSKYEIAAITGHALKSIDQIMKHYLVLNNDMADSAIDKVVTWMKKEGIRV